jgi:hypothetical protein
MSEHRSEQRGMPEADTFGGCSESPAQNTR